MPKNRWENSKERLCAETIIADARTFLAAAVGVAAAGLVRSRANRRLRKAFGVGAAALGTFADKGVKPCFAGLFSGNFNSIANYFNTTKLIRPHRFDN